MNSILKTIAIFGSVLASKAFAQAAGEAASTAAVSVADLNFLAHFHR